MGAKRTPMPKKSGMTVLGVRMGCHAFNRCWRKALSVRARQSSFLFRMLLRPVFKSTTLTHGSAYLEVCDSSSFPLALSDCC